MGTDLWKYCTKSQSREALLSLGLLDRLPPGQRPSSGEKQLALLYALSNHAEEHYRSVQIPKRFGGSRTLLVPDPLLKTVQRNILRRVLEGLPVSPYAAAYQKGKGLLDNARPHVGRERLLKLDIRDFFGNITFISVYQHAFPAALFPPDVRTLLTNLCCVKDALPQGAPSSPAISNLVMRPFDDYMGAWCLRKKIAYTRYSDDLTFSGDLHPEEVTACAEGFLGALGFSLNPRKSRSSGQGGRQCVTGIVVNDKAQAPKAYRRETRREVYQTLRFFDGSPEAKSRLPRLLGKVAHILYLNPEDTWFRRAQRELQSLLDPENAPVPETGRPDAAVPKKYES